MSDPLASSAAMTPQPFDRETVDLVRAARLREHGEAVRLEIHAARVEAMRQARRARVLEQEIQQLRDRVQSAEAQSRAMVRVVAFGFGALATKDGHPGGEPPASGAAVDATGSQALAANQVAAIQLPPAPVVRGRVRRGVRAWVKRMRRLDSAIDRAEATALRLESLEERMSARVSRQALRGFTSGDRPAAPDSRALQGSRCLGGRAMTGERASVLAALVRSNLKLRGVVS